MAHRPYERTSHGYRRAHRSRVLLFSQPGALPAPALEELITKIKELDMDEVRAEIAARAATADA